MGKRINVIIGDSSGEVGAVLFSNSSHPEVDAEKILHEVAKRALGATSLTKALLGRTYPSDSFVNKQGDPVFGVDTQPGDHEKVLFVDENLSISTVPCDFAVKMTKTAGPRTYLVRLKITIGEYEKTGKHLVEAANEQEAGKTAITREAHDKLEWEEWGAYDCAGAIAYQVASVKKIDPADVDTMKRYF